MRAIERSVCGCDYGGTSWTTREQCEQISALLELRPGMRLLDVGAGSGWPALYMTGSSGCDIVLVDLPLAGLKIAAERAVLDGIISRCRVAVADGANLLFPDECFDAVSHSDLLCCLGPKRAVLGACRRVIRRGGRMVFSVLSVAPGLSPADYSRAVENGPEFIESEADYSTLLTETGWGRVERFDLTTDYAASCRRQLEADEEHEEALQTLIGASEFGERNVGWRSKLTAIGDGLLRRELFVATSSST